MAQRRPNYRPVLSQLFCPLVQARHKFGFPKGKYCVIVCVYFNATHVSQNGELPIFFALYHILIPVLFPPAPLSVSVDL